MSSSASPFHCARADPLGLEPGTLGDHLLKVGLPDGKQLEVESDATAADVAAQIGPRLARAAVAARVTINGDTQMDIADATYLTTHGFGPINLVNDIPGIGLGT